MNDPEDQISQAASCLLQALGAWQATSYTANAQKSYQRRRILGLCDSITEAAKTLREREPADVHA